ncbi:MAG: circularly permuted type 2 ATP-grasp protein [Pseudomonadota bacterium]|nr:circularly permuted type 2 ATP-grasp protein [Pseudomonadota bacterium]
MSTDALAAFLSAYRRPDGVPDELLGPDGQVRPVWSAFMQRLARISPEDMATRMSRGDQYLRDAGVFYRRYAPAEASDRDWPLSHMPVLIAEAEWHEIAAGLTQRADLLEAVLADLYGDNRLVAEGHLPPPLVAQNADWLRPLVGVRPRSGHFLHFVAFDIGRGPEGQWWVLSDRTQAPSGAGFALENRIATARVYSGLYDNANVTRLAGFFRAFRDALMGLRASESSRVGILTPGPMNDTYFEHAYIARYLGFMLLEGEDLVVDSGRLMVRTVDGLKPISVLWRRLDASWADPLELNEGSRLGTPGLVGALRNGSVTMVNALGAGVLEARAFLAFLPKLSRVLLDEPLRMPNIATWWCGGAKERAYVQANARGMTISGAYSTGLAFELEDMLPQDLGAEALAARIAHDGPRLVGQEQVQLSTTPAFVDGRLQPRPMSLRVFLARTASGWQVMPGGFARIGLSDASTGLAMQKGGLVSDVWVIGARRAQSETMLPRAAETVDRNQPGALPSRAADNLFWLGRYVERTEHMLRILRAYHARLAETANPEAPLPAAIAHYLAGLGVDPDEPIPDALMGALSAANSSAGHVRDRFSVDGSAALSELMETTRGLIGKVAPGDDAARAMGRLLRQVSGFSGLVQDNMYRFNGWRFLSIGRALERAANMTGSLLSFSDPGAAEGALDLVIEIGDSAMSHRRRYSVSTDRGTVLDLLALDGLNPRSVLFQLEEIRQHLQFLPGNAPHRRLSALQRSVLRAHTDLSLQNPEDVDGDFLARLSTEILSVSENLTHAYLR